MCDPRCPPPVPVLSAARAGAGARRTVTETRVPAHPLLKRDGVDFPPLSGSDGRADPREKRFLRTSRRAGTKRQERLGALAAAATGGHLWRSPHGRAGTDTGEQPRPTRAPGGTWVLSLRVLKSSPSQRSAGCVHVKRPGLAPRSHVTACQRPQAQREDDGEHTGRDARPRAGAGGCVCPGHGPRVWKPPTPTAPAGSEVAAGTGPRVRPGRGGLGRTGVRGGTGLRGARSRGSCGTAPPGAPWVGKSKGREATGGGGAA